MARTKNFKEEEVLEKAMQVFWYKGYHGTSMQDLVTHMGINRASMYNTYGDKQTLFVAALKHYQQKQSEQIQQAFVRSGSALQVIRSVLERMVAESLQDRQQKGCFMVNATVELANQDQNISKMAIANEETMEYALAEVIRKGQASGEISNNQDAAGLSAYLFAAIQGLKIMSLTNTKKDRLHKVIDTIMVALN